MQTKLGNLVLDQWVDGDGDGNVLTSAVDGTPLARITSTGLDFSSVLQHARQVGGSNLRKLTFHQRGEMLKALAQYLMEHKKEFYALSTATGATRADSWVDIDGGISTLFRRSCFPKTVRLPLSISLRQNSVPRFTSMHSTSRAGECSKNSRQHYWPAYPPLLNPHPVPPI